MAHDERHPDRLGRRMRDGGVPPERDLLPEINAAIDREEARRSVRPPDRVPWPRLMAVAAALTVVLVSAWTAVYRDETGLGPLPGPQLAAREETDPGDGGMDVIDRALDELNRALATDPENRNLSRLVLMIHQKRGDLLLRTDGTGDLE
jgi:hypothetical protein